MHSRKTLLVSQIIILLLYYGLLLLLSNHYTDRYMTGLDCKILLENNFLRCDRDPVNYVYMVRIRIDSNGVPSYGP